ncbi:unnamed protein product [Sphagnum troendelagicum]|uniref:Uncharacterized protein n=1 Tax=Sphagnum troendelagicum TaxID=128251 RepID=A0ABP0TFG0_9BRYO
MLAVRWQQQNGSCSNGDSSCHRTTWLIFSFFTESFTFQGIWTSFSTEPDARPPHGAAFRTGDRSTFMTPLQPNRPSLHVTFNTDWLCKDLSVVGLGLIGWIAPFSIPVINGNSLTGKAKDAGGQNESSSCNRAAE